MVDVVAGFGAQLRDVVVVVVPFWAVAGVRFSTRYQTIALSRDSSRMKTTAGRGRRTDAPAMVVLPPLPACRAGREAGRR